MTLNHTHIGIDICKAHLDCYAMPAGKSKRFTNSPAGIKACINWICKQPDLYRIVFEPTGGYERHLLRALQDEGLPASMVSAYSVQHFRKAKNDSAKTDDIDACLLAYYGLAMNPDVTKIKPVYLSDLSDVIHRRLVLKQIRGAESTRIEKVNNKKCLKSIKTHMAYLDKGIKALDAEIKLILKSNELEQKAIILMKNKGVSHITAATLLADLPELGTLSRGEIARLVGVAPMNKDSGTSQGQRHIRGGRKDVRNAWYMASFVASQHNKPLKEFYQKLIKKGKPHRVAVTACMRKFIVWINAQMANHINGKEVFIMN